MNPLVMLAERLNKSEITFFKLVNKDDTNIERTDSICERFNAMITRLGLRQTDEIIVNVSEPISPCELFTLESILSILSRMILNNINNKFKLKIPKESGILKG